MEALNGPLPQHAIFTSSKPSHKNVKLESDSRHIISEDKGNSVS